MNKLWLIYTTEYYTTLKKNEPELSMPIKEDIYSLGDKECCK